MDRRAFLGTLGLLAAPLAAEAQPAVLSPKAPPLIGHLGSSVAVGTSRIQDAFRQGLRESGWVEGRTVRIEWRWSEGRAERFAELVADLIRLKVDVIVTGSSQATQAAKEASAALPIVFAGVANPVGLGFVTSLARPGGNVTGVTNQLSDLAGKALQLARETLPALKRVGVLWNPADPGSALGFKDAQDAYPALGVKVISAPVRSADDFDAAFEVLSRERPEFLIVHPSPLIFVHRRRVADFALRQRLPTSTGRRDMVEDGSTMMSYAPDGADLYRRAAGYVDKILRGARPADLPVEQPTRFELVVSQRVAKAIGLTLPAALLSRADQFIE